MKRYILITIGILWTAFIFGQSLMSATISSQQSGIVINLIHPILTKIGIHIEVDNLSFIVRKLAHFIEFFILGIVWFYIFFPYAKKVQYSRFVLLFGLMVAITDEAIQLYSEGRAGLASDVLIDFSGVLFAYLMGVTFYSLKKKNINKNLKI